MMDTVVKISVVTIAVSLAVLAGTNTYATFAASSHNNIQAEPVIGAPENASTSECITQLYYMIDAKGLMLDALNRTEPTVIVTDKTGAVIEKPNALYNKISSEHSTINSHINTMVNSCTV